MVSSNFVLYGLRVWGETAWDFVYFPIWWYTRGLFEFLGFSWDFLCYRQKSLALFVWIGNIFTPMYGQRDWQGFLISVMIRIVQIIFRSIIMCFWIAVALLMILVWLFFPPFILYQIFFQLL